jgi:hypothetical protein
MAVQPSSDASLIQAAREVVRAENAARLVAFLDENERAERDAELIGAIARLREVVRRQDGVV